MQDKIKALKKEVTELQQKLHEKNRNLDAMGWVWCSGGCEGGSGRFLPSNKLTLEMVEVAERNTKRMRSWIENEKFKKQWEQWSPEQQEQWLEDIARRRSAGLLPGSDSTKKISTCCNEPMVSLSGEEKNICPSCATTYDWPLKEGVQSILTKRVGRKKDYDKPGDRR